MKAASYPDFKKIRNLSDEQEIALLRKLIWLYSEGLLAFGSYNGETWDEGAYPFLIMNDTFDYACADAEDFQESDLDLLVELAKRYDYHGTIAWAAIRRREDPLPSLVTPEYEAAKEYIKNRFLVDGYDSLLEFSVPPVLGSAERELQLLYRLIWLASRDVLSFSTHEKWGEGDRGIHCFGNMYAFNHYSPIDLDTLDLWFELYGKFGMSGLDAWEVFKVPNRLEWLQSLSPGTQGSLMLTEGLYEALKHLRNP